jgi:hypothetical protein
LQGELLNYQIEFVIGLETSHTFESQMADTPSISKVSYPKMPRWSQGQVQSGHVPPACNLILQELPKFAKLSVMPVEWWDLGRWEGSWNTWSSTLFGE